MAVKWTRDGDTWTATLKGGQPACEVILEHNGGPESGPDSEWCVRTNNRCRSIHIKGLKQAKIRGTRYLVGCLKPKE